MPPYEALYGRKCRTPLCWAETVRMIMDRLLAVQDRQKKYYDAKHRSVEFNMGNFVYIKIRPMKGVLRFDKVGKLSPRYIGPFEIIERIKNVAYRLALPTTYDVHNVFHVSPLRKFITDDPSKIITEEVDIQSDLTYVEEPYHILEFNVKQLRSREISFVKVLQKHGLEKNATWEKKTEMRKCYPHLFE
ncbi:hypothetical protein MA16_Dca022358 [Dendrobium catenatum]|uniref:Tf2-1-like SH3-like domain-containing protein n=1 Tax=Dendrobium catenatum TaxID=906689 RepID=A0A2I0VVF1_9ASPA|nr:hypothetical protein MA16_Dca022358 [Dendrobium catenatum]